MRVLFVTPFPASTDLYPTSGRARQPPLHVCASGAEGADSGELLHGVCWLRYGEALDCLVQAVLLLRCEWADAGTDSWFSGTPGRTGSRPLQGKTIRRSWSGWRE